VKHRYAFPPEISKPAAWRRVWPRITEQVAIEFFESIQALVDFINCGGAIALFSSLDITAVAIGAKSVAITTGTKGTKVRTAPLFA
jgi:hypothetical protein